MSYSLVVPSIVESASTGWIMSGKKTLYRQEWEIKIIRDSGGQVGTVVYKNGEEVGLSATGQSKAFIKFWNAFISFYNSTNNH